MRFCYLLAAREPPPSPHREAKDGLHGHHAKALLKGHYEII